MCVVTYISTSNGCIITSNRDEKVERNTLYCQNKIINNQEVTFPKEPKNGGTWIAHTNKNAIVLLNGAVEKHEGLPKYAKSRGIIVLEIISHENPLEFWEIMDLSEIEPFTIIFFYERKLYQLQWNFIEKSLQDLDTTQHYIWSSATLYSKESREKRQNKFIDWQQNNQNITAESIIQFHENEKMPEMDNIRTISISQIIVEQNIIMNHINLLEC